MMKKGKRRGYSADLAGKMYLYFISYDDAGAPSFSKFARSIGITLSELESYRAHQRFERAYRECSEIRRDYLIDRALTKRFDATFVKYLLGSDDNADGSDGELTVRLEVLE